MSGILTTALTGFFLLSAATGTLTETSVLAPQDEPAKEIITVRSGPRRIMSEEQKTTVLATHIVSMTGYNAVPEQTDGDPFTTASGAYSNPDIVAARSVDLKEELPFGTIIEVVESATNSWCGFGHVKEHIGYRVIADSMHPRMEQKIDILFGDETVTVGGKERNVAKALGMCKNVRINVVGFVPIKDIPATQAELKSLIGKGLLSVNK